MNVRLADLLAGVEVSRCTAPGDLKVTGLSYDSRRLRPGHLFFALPGERTDGSRFAAEALTSGASAVVSPVPLSDGVPSVTVPDARRAMADMATAFYGHPSGGMKVIGVTGTNGKTTVTYLCRHLLASLRCGLIGTIAYHNGLEASPAPRTTPESIDLQALLAEMRDNGCKAVAMEVSSHGLVQHRVRGVSLNVAVFTNLSRDHLDFHGSMSAYFEAKSELFDALEDSLGHRGRAVINIDDRYGRMIEDRFRSRLEVITFGRSMRAAFRASDIRTSQGQTSFHLHAKGKSYLVRLPLIGAFNVSNALATLAATNAAGLDLRSAVAGLAEAPQVPGRLQRIGPKRHFDVFVDYAHTDDALRNVLVTLRELDPVRLTVVVGCGGDRDKSKRAPMAAVATSIADRCFFTTDNPRSEDPGQILDQMVAGATHSNYTVIPDRREAIGRAIADAVPREIILIAGKGHENYQEVHGERTPFDDSLIASEEIRRHSTIQEEEQ